MSNDRPDAFIQWKGTDACIDLYCTCGEQFHFDGYFAYELTCGHCGQTYEMPNMLRVHPVEPSRGLKLIFDETEVIRDGEFEIPWPRGEFNAVKPGETFEVYDEVDCCTRSAYVTFVRAEPADSVAAMKVIVRNTGRKP